MSAHVQPARIFQGVSFALESAQHEQSVQDVSFAHDREAEFTQVGGWDVSSDSDAGHSAVEESDRGDSVVEGSDEGDSDVEGSEEHFDESEHVDDLAEEERSTDGEEGFGEEVDEISRVRTREKDAAVRRGVTLRRRRVVVGCCGPEGSDFAAEEN